MLSASHLILVFLVALLVFGPEKLPELARTLSKTMAEFHRLTGDFQETIQREIRQLEQEPVEGRPSNSPTAQEELTIPPAESSAVPDAAAYAEEAPANTFEGLQYEEASYVASAAEGTGEKWRSEESTGNVTPDGSSHDVPAAGALPAVEPAETASLSSQEKSPLASGSEKPVNDHPTAA